MTRSGAWRNDVNAASVTDAAMSAATEQRGGLSSTTTSRPVRLDRRHDAVEVERAEGAQAEDVAPIALAGELLGRVQSGCERLADARDRDVVARAGDAELAERHRLDRGRGTGPRSRYSAMCSMKITGLSSSIAASSRPCASAGVAGTTTLSPGTWVKSG